MEPASFVPPQNVDVGEAILAVVGVRPFLTREVERIGADDWREISRIEFRVSRLAQQLVQGTLEPAGSAEVDYEPTLQAFTQPPDDKQIEAMLQDVPAEYASAFLGQAARAINSLREVFPISVERTMFGAHQLDPALSRLLTFEDAEEIVDQPLNVFDMIAAGRVTKVLADLLQQVYPSLYTEILGAIVDRIAQEKVEHPSYEPEFARGMAVMLGAPGVDPKLAQALEAAGQREQQAAEARLQVSSAKSARAQRVSTASERAEAI